MTPSLWVTALIFVGTTVVSLSIAYMHRKQMRQIELYRQNAKSGVKPPPHPVTRFLREYWWDAFLFVGAVHNMVRWFVEESQHSYHAGVSAALALWLFVNLMGAQIIRIMGRMREVMTMMVELHDRSLTRAGLLMADTEMLTGIVAQIVNDLKDNGHLSKKTTETVVSRLDEWTLKVRQYRIDDEKSM